MGELGYGTVGVVGHNAWSEAGEPVVLLRGLSKSLLSAKDKRAKIVVATAPNMKKNCTSFVAGLLLMRMIDGIAFALCYLLKIPLVRKNKRCRSLLKARRFYD
jgi:hypothetical protein